MPCGLGAHASQYDPTSPTPHRIDPCKFAISAAQACAFPPSASAATISASARLETSRKVIHKAIDLGVTLFDTADIYAGMGGSETVLGQVLGDRRKDIVLATKYSKPMNNDGTKQGASRRYIMSAVEASLTRLKTDYIDLYSSTIMIR